MADFVYIHGGMHSGWCWEELLPAMRSLGHTGIAIDYPCDDPNAGAADHAATIAEQIAHAPDDVIVVAHSIGGLVAPVLAVSRPVRSIVFLCAAIPAVGYSFAEQIDAVPESGTVMVPDENGCVTFSREDAVTLFYQGLGDQVTQRCLDRLRPQSLKQLTERAPLSQWPQLPLFSIYCADDRAISPLYARVAGQHHGMTLFDLPGCHSPFYQQPDRVAQILDEISRALEQ